MDGGGGCWRVWEARRGSWRPVEVRGLVEACGGGGGKIMTYPPMDSIKFFGTVHTLVARVVGQP
jgi:hypothetical protein